MTEDKFSHSELMEFRDKLHQIKNMCNTLIEEMDISHFLNANMSKDKTTVDNIYYAGGTLCMDLASVDNNEKPFKATVLMNICDETISWIIDGEQKPRSLMNIKTLWFAFSIYGSVKGHHRKYYRECYQKSCIRHLYNFLMERRPVDEKGTLPDEAILGIYDMAVKATEFADELLSKYGIDVKV